MKKKPDGTIVLHVERGLAGETLAAAVRAMRPSISWSEARRLVARRQVQIDGNLCLDEGRRLKVGEVIKLHADPIARLPDERDIELAYVDSSLVVVNKPPGLNSVRHAEERNWSARRKQFQPTLDELLPRVLAGGGKRERPDGSVRRSGRGPGSRVPERPERLPRVYPVHRLDRETSGLMVFARNTQVEADLIRQFSSHDIERVYHAIVRGRPEARTIETILVRDRGDGVRGSVPEDHPAAEGGQWAVTHVRPLKSAGDWSLVECRLETGRTHQIRIHLSESGHPLCGDRKYLGPRGAAVTADNSGARRVALHATRLGLTHPASGRELVFESPFPRDLQELWNRLASPRRPARDQRERAD